MKFNYKNSTVHYTDTGTGTAILLLHGFLEDYTIWKEIAEKLSKNNRIITIDLLGHGKTGNIGYIHTMENQADMVFTLLKSLKLQKVILIGHSMGGYVSLAFADKYTHSVKGICLLNSTPFSDSEEKKEIRNRAIEVVKNDKTGFLTESIPNLFSEGHRELYKKDIQKLINTARKMEKQGIVNALEGMKIRPDYSSFFKEAQFRKSIIIGREDTVLNLKNLIKTYKGTDVYLIMLKGGHMSYLEDREKCILALESFVKSCN
ncbi:MAG: alpha/beta hydrolase [Flavobacteriales bacterium]|nr:MAG: alpha/beta hydrolase [Flavobacteriales bacterium]